MALSSKSCALRATPQFVQTLDKSRLRVLSAFRFPNPIPILSRLGPPRSLRRPPIRMAALSSQVNTTPVAASSSSGCRIAEVKRVTKETNVYVNINLDGSGVSNCSTGIPFLDHMLDQLASHGLFDLCVKASGDIHIDDHHTNEDVALAIGTVHCFRP